MCAASGQRHLSPRVSVSRLAQLTKSALASFSEMAYLSPEDAHSLELATHIPGAWWYSFGSCCRVFWLGGGKLPPPSQDARQQLPKAGLQCAWSRSAANVGGERERHPPSHFWGRGQTSNGQSQSEVGENVEKLNIVNIERSLLTPCVRHER
eukprot:188937-Chlamydomonas_euryale.AAC.1